VDGARVRVKRKMYVALTSRAAASARNAMN